MRQSLLTVNTVANGIPKEKKLIFSSKCVVSEKKLVFILKNLQWLQTHSIWQRSLRRFALFCIQEIWKGAKGWIAPGTECQHENYISGNWPLFRSGMACHESIAAKPSLCLVNLNLSSLKRGNTRHGISQQYGRQESLDTWSCNSLFIFHDSTSRRTNSMMLHNVGAKNVHHQHYFVVIFGVVLSI